MKSPTNPHARTHTASQPFMTVAALVLFSKNTGATVAAFSYGTIGEYCTLDLILTVVGQDRFSPTETHLANSTWSETSRIKIWAGEIKLIT